MKLPYPLMYLPGFSFLNFVMTQENKELHPENFKDEELVYTPVANIKFYLHVIYIALTSFYILYGVEFKDFNICNWPNIIDKNRKDAAKYHALSKIAIDIASNLDGNPSLNLSELAILYEESGMNFKIDPEKPYITLPKIPSKNLERFISDCESKKVGN